MELSPETQAALEKRYRSAAFLVLSQIGLTFVLIIISWFVLTARDNPPSKETLMPLWIGALFIAMGTFVLRRTLYRWDRLKDIAILKGITGVLDSLKINSIILGAMAELIAVIGFVISFLGGNPYEMLRAGAIALVVFLINFPRKSVWQKIAANLENV